jgi:pimeloyl-ACP methyl ester carboxylesterase
MSKGKSVFHLSAERAKALAVRRGQAKRLQPEMLKDVARLIGVALPVPKALRTEVGEVAREGYRIKKLAFVTEPGITVPGLLFTRGDKDRGPVVLYLHGSGKVAGAAPGGQLEKLVKSGRRALALDLRGLGETAPGMAPAGRPSYFGVDVKEAFVALHLNRPLLGQRARDLLAVVEALAPESPDGFELLAQGTTGPIALHAAALERRIKRVTLEQSLVSWASVVQTPISYNQLTNVVPGALAVYDLPELAATLAPRPLTLRQGVDAAGKPVDQGALERAWAAARAGYRRAEAEKGLILAAGGAEGKD